MSGIRVSLVRLQDATVRHPSPLSEKWTVWRSVSWDRNTAYRLRRASPMRIAEKNFASIRARR